MTVNEEIKDKNTLYKSIKLGRLGRFGRGGNLSKQNLSEDGTGFDTILYGDIYTKYNFIVSKPVNKVDEQSYLNAKKINKNTFLFTDSGETKEDIGKCILYNGENEIAVGIHIITFKLTNKEIDDKYLAYYLNSYDVRIYKAKNSTGSTIDCIYAKNLKNILVRFPDIKTQKKIADFLDKKVNAIDRSLEYTKGMINNLLELKKSYPNTLVINAKGEKQRLGCLLRERSIKNRPEMQFLSVSRDKGVIVKQIGEKGIALSDLNKAKLVRKGQFVISNMMANKGAYGVSKYDGIVSPAYFVFDLFVKNKEFFNVAIRTKYYIDQFARISEGIRYNGLDLSKVEMKKIIFYLPSEEKQKEIGEKGTRVVENIDKLLEILRKKVQVLEELKQSLIFEVVTGKRDVRDVL